MTQYIDKDLLVAELKKRFDYRVNSLKAINNGTFWGEDQSENDFNASFTRCAYNEAKNEIFELMCFLDTLKVEEVDLNEEIANKYESNYEEYLTYEEFADIARHFFKLGLKVVQKGK